MREKTPRVAKDNKSTQKLPKKVTFVLYTVEALQEISPSVFRSRHVGKTPLIGVTWHILERKSAHVFLTSWGMVVCKMAAVGCMRDNGTMEGEESSEKEGELIKMCRKNGIHQDCFMGESARDSLDSKFARTERPQRVNGTSKSVSAIFTKPSIPTLRSRRDKTSLEQSKRRRRLSKGESVDQRSR